MICGVNCDACGHVSFETCMNCDGCVMPKELRRSLLGGFARARSRTGIHVSMLLGCLTHSYLNAKYGTYVKLEDIYHMSRGNAIHRKLQWSYPKKEIAVSHDFDGVKVWGTIDALGEDGWINEFKTCTWLPKRPYSHHIKQISAYDTIQNLEGTAVPGCRLIYVSMQGIRTFDVKPLDMRAWITRRAKLLADSLQKEVCPPSELEPDEKWRSKFCPFKILCKTHCDSTSEISVQSRMMT